MSYKENRNPRFNRTFTVTLSFGDFSLLGRAVNPSAFGASVEVSEIAYEQLSNNPFFWENTRPFKISTSLNDLPAAINSLYEKDGKFFISLKLLENRSWYR